MSQVEQLKAFVEAVKANPAMLQEPSLAFFRDFITKTCGGQIPKATDSKPAPKPAAPKPAAPPAAAPAANNDISDDTASESAGEPTFIDKDDADIWPSVEGDGEDVVLPELPEEVTEADEEAANAAKAEAADLTEAGKLEEAFNKLTDAIKLNPLLPMTYAARAQLSLKLKRPLSAIKDCDRALELNSNSARALRLRGRAYRHIGSWEKAAESIRESQKIDYDDSLRELEKLVYGKLADITTWRREDATKGQRRRQRALRRQRAQEQEEDRAERAREAAQGGFPGAGGFPGGFPGAGGMPGGFPGAGGMPGGMPDLSALGGMGGIFTSLAPQFGVTPEEMADPQVKEAFAAIPGDMAKVAALSAASPTVKAAVAKVMNGAQSLMGGMGGAGGMDFASMMGGMGGGGMGGAGGPPFEADSDVD